MAFANLNPSTAQTDIELVAASAHGHKIVVYSLFVSSDIQQIATLESAGSTLVWRQYVGVTGGQAHSASRGLFESKAGENLALTTSEVGNLFISVEYEYVFVSA